jgi:tetratricopeptide (TPR) repeat protein
VSVGAAKDSDDDFDFDIVESIPQPAASAPAASAPAAQDNLDETGMSWLQDETPVPSQAVAGKEGGGDLESLFDEEDDFFDLAAELEAELGSEGMARVDTGVSSMESQEGTLEEIIEGFKQGVAEHLADEDYDTHFNLGIAYREMGLLDEAIGEFQVSSKDEHYLAESAGMLGMCFNEKGLPELAVRWYKKGLESPQINDDATIGLLYDLATTYESMGEPESAYRTFVEIYGINTNFRDAAAKMQELAPQKQA